MQALVAVSIVGIGAWLLNVTAKTMCGAERAIEIASYGLIAAWRPARLDQGQRLLRELIFFAERGVGKAQRNTTISRSFGLNDHHDQRIQDHPRPHPRAL